jgi:seryl-tRNA synthetase
LENEHPDLALERSRIFKETDREKRDLMARN